MADVYIEELNKADSLSDDDTVLLHTKTEDLQLTIGILKALMTVEKATKLATPFLVSITGDAIGNGNTDGRETLTIKLSNIKASSLKNSIKINGTNFDGTEGITTERWGAERTVTIGGCERKVNGETDVNFPANEVFSGSGQPYVPTAGGAMTGNLKREINESSYNLFEATTENEESGVSVKLKIGDINASAIIQSLSQPYWHNGVNLKKLLTGEDIYELERRTSELESMSTQTFKNPYKNKTIIAFGDSILAGWGWKEGTGIIQPLKEKYTDATWINKAESGANMAVTSNPSHTPIVTQIKNYTGAADAIIFDGGVNDNNSSIPVGSIESGYDASYNTGTFCGALESALQYIMDRYPLAVKLYIIPHSFAKDNSYVDSIYSKAIEICDKWNMPYLDMRKCSQIAMTSKNKSKYTRNANSGVGDGVHPVESWYRTFYSPVIDQKLRNLGIGYTTAPVAPTVIAVTSVSLGKNTLSIKKGESATLTATVKPSNATNQSVKWSTSNSNVTVSNGEVTGKAVGTSVVTVTTDDGGYTAQCTVNVAENTVNPSESHTKLESLSVDGNCYFDTEILSDQNTNTEAKLYVKSGTTYICGARDDKYKYGYSTTDNFYVVRGSVSSAVKSTAFWEDAWTIKQNGATATFGNNSVTLDNAGNFTLTSPYYIGCMSKNGEAAGVGLKGKIYYAKIYSGDTLVADMIPVEKSDGTLCLYDKVRKKYIYNDGTGTVTE